MRSKSFGLFALSILALVFIAGLASADIVFSPTSLSQTTITGQTSVAVNFNLVHTGVGGNYTGLTWTSNSTVGTWTLPTSQTTLNTSQSIPLSATLTGIPSNFTGTINGNIIVTASGGSPTETLPVTITVSQALSETAICTDDGVSTNNGDLKVDVRDITVTDGFGKDDEWLLLDEVEVELRVENNGNFDIDDISLEWAIANDALTDYALDWDEVDEFNLKDGDEDTFTVTFRVDDDDLDMDLDQLSGLDYNLVVRATGVIDDSNNGPFDNTDTCAADFSEISIQSESDFVILDNINVPETVQCGDTIQVTADVWNIGDSQQDEVSVDVYNKERNIIDQIFEVGDIDEFEKTELSFNIEVPNDAEEKIHTLFFRVLNEDDDVYENSYDDDLAEFSVPLTVSGSCSGSSGSVSVTASIASGGREGQELVVNARITNNENSQKVYALNVIGFEDWASSFSLDQNSLALGAGESANVEVTLDVSDDSAGERTFFLEMTSNGAVTRQPVTLSIAESKGFLSGITGNALGGNGLIWGIGLLNILLVVVIIIVAVRIARRK